MIAIYIKSLNFFTNAKTLSINLLSLIYNIIYVNYLDLSQKCIIFVAELKEESMEIIVPIGISGSGKTRLYNMRYKNYTLLSPDLIRKELTGSISDQRKNREVFEEVDRRVADYVKNGESFFYDATNVNTEFRKKFVNQFEGTDVKIIYVIIPADTHTSLQRIKKDLKNKVERSDVPSHAIIRQYGMYTHSLKINFDGENVQEIIYIKEGDLD